MDILWTRKEATVREVLGQLNQTRSLAYTTVLTVMSRLMMVGLI
jgi:predicted transcriptional regulator